MAHEWRAALKPSAGSAVRKKYERLLLAFERSVSEGAPSRPLPNLQALKAAERRVRRLNRQWTDVQSLACDSRHAMHAAGRVVWGTWWRVPYPHGRAVMEWVCLTLE